MLSPPIITIQRIAAKTHTLPIAIIMSRNVSSCVVVVVAIARRNVVALAALAAGPVFAAVSVAAVLDCQRALSRYLDNQHKKIHALTASLST